MSTGRFCAERRVAEVLVHRVEAGQQLGEALRADRPASSTGRWPSPSSSGPPTQSQKPNMFAVSIPNSATRSAFVETATKCLAIADSSPSSAERPIRAPTVALVSVSSVPKVFEETMKSVSSAARSRVASGEVGGVDIGDEAEGQVPVGVVPQRLVCHHRAEVGAADADIDDVADRLAGMALPLTRADPLGEVGHPVEDLMDLGDDVDAVDDERGPLAACAVRHAAPSGSPTR